MINDIKQISSRMMKEGTRRMRIKQTTINKQRICINNTQNNNNNNQILYNYHYHQHYRQQHQHQHHHHENTKQQKNRDIIKYKKYREIMYRQQCKLKNIARTYGTAGFRTILAEKEAEEDEAEEEDTFGENEDYEVDDEAEANFQLGQVRDGKAYEQENVALYLKKEKGYQRKRKEEKENEENKEEMKAIRDIAFIKDVTSKFKDKIEKQRYLPFELSKDNYNLLKQAKILPQEMEDRIQIKYDNDTGMPNYVDITDEEYWKATYRVMYDLDDMLQQEESLKAIENNPELKKPKDYFKKNGIEDPTANDYHKLLWEQAHYAGDAALVEETLEDMRGKLKIRVPSNGYLNAVLYANAREKNLSRCKKWLDLMIHEFQIVPSVITWSIMVYAYCQKKKLDEAMQLIEMLREYDIPTSIVMHTNLLQVMFKLNEFKRAENHFHFMQSRYGIKPDIITFNVMLKIYEKTGQVEKAFSTYSQLEMRELFPTTETFTHLIGACVVRKSHRPYVFPLVEQMEKLGFKPSKQVLNAMIDAAARNADPDLASRLFSKMKKEYNMTPTGTTYTHLFFALAANQKLGTKYQNRNIAKANELYMHLINNEPHIVIHKKMLDAYMRVYTGANRVTKSLEFFNMKYAEHSMTPGRYSYGNLIEMYCRMGQVERAIQLKEKMIIEHNIHPTRHSYLNIIHALFKLGDHDRVHDWMMLMKREGGYLLSPDEIRHIQIKLKQTTSAYKELLVQRTNVGYNELE